MDAIWTWLANTWPTLLICAALAALLVMAAISLIRDKRRGGGCGCGCGGCALRDRCHGAGGDAPAADGTELTDGTAGE